jgi:phosphoglycerate kinase
MADSSLLPALPPGATRKRNILDVLEALESSASRNVLVRVDFNVPMNADGEITDDSRIRGALPTIQVILRHKCNAILVSHMGRPKLVQKNEDNEETRLERETLSLQPVAKHLSALLNQDVLFAPDCLNAQDTIDQLPKEGGGLVLLNNLRFYKQEEKNDKQFAQTLANYADAYVNDAFGTCHRAHASTAGVPALMDAKLCGIGCLVASELAYLDFSTVTASDRIAAIIGGSKVSTKLPVIQGILKSADVLVLQGGLAFTFLKAQNISVGSSLLEDSMLDTARELLEQAQQAGKEMVLPIDAVCAKTFPKGPMDKADTETFDLTSEAGIPEGWMGLDIGPKSVELFANKLQGTTKIVFNGPAGVFEVTPFDEGTRGLVQTIKELTKNGTVSVVGGGDSVAALEQFGETESVSYVSTGGGATLELLAGDALPGVTAIEDFQE